MKGFSRRADVVPASSYLVVTGRPWCDEALDLLADALEDLTTPPQERVHRALSAMATARADAERLVLVVQAASRRLHPDLAAVRGLLSGRDCVEMLADADPADRLTLEAAVLLEAAFATSPWADPATGADGWARFHQMADEADELGRRALAARAGDPAAAVGRLLSARALGLPTAEWWQRLDVARSECATLVPAHLELLQSVAERWHGDHDTMLDSARRTARDVPLGHPASAVLPLAHAELFFALRAGPDSARIDVEQRHDEGIIAQHSAALRGAPAPGLPGAHLRAVEANQAFGWYFSLSAHSDRFADARHEHLRRAAGRMAELPWQHYAEPEQIFREVMSEAAVPSWAAAATGSVCPSR